MNAKEIVEKPKPVGRPRSLRPRAPRKTTFKESNEGEGRPMVDAVEAAVDPPPAEAESAQRLAHYMCAISSSSTAKAAACILLTAGMMYAIVYRAIA